MKIYDEFEIDISDKIIEVKPNLKDIEITPSKEEQIFESDGVNGYGNIKVEGVNLQDKEVTPKIEKQEIIADEEYLALNKVIVNPVTSEIDNNITPENIRRGISILGVDGDLETVKPGQEKAITPTKEEQMVIPDEGFELSKVIVNPIPLQVKEVEPSKEEVVVVPDEEDLALEKVIVKPVVLESKEVVPKEEVIEVLPDENSIGLEKVIVNPIPEDYIIPTGTVTIDRNGIHNVRDVENVDVGVYPVLQNKEVTPSIEVQEVGADSEYYGLNKVQVNPIPNEFKNTSDANISAEDVKEGKIAYGVEGQIIGTHTEPVLGSKNITENGTYNPSDDNLDGYNEVNVQIPPAGVEDYFDLTLDYANSNPNYWIRDNFIKKFPDIVIPNDKTRISYLCANFNASQKILPKIICGNQVKAMDGLYLNSSLSKTVDITGLDTSNVTTMFEMFKQCSNLIDLDLSTFNTNQVTNMSGMFSNCTNLKTLNLTNWNTENVYTMRNMFLSCNYLQSLDVSHFNVSNVTDMFSIFAGCQRIPSLDLSNWDTSKVTDMTNMFQSCKNLSEIIGIENLKTSNCSQMQQMFYYNLLTELDLSKWDVGSISNITSMFAYMGELTSINLSNWNSEKLTNISSLFSNCKKLETINMSGMDLGKVNNDSGTFTNCSALQNLTLGKDLGKSFTYAYNNNYNKINLLGCTNLTNESIIDICNKVYDLTLIGKTQAIAIHSTCKARLEATEEGQAAIALAQSKGWTIVTS